MDKFKLKGIVSRMRFSLMMISLMTVSLMMISLMTATAHATTIINGSGSSFQAQLQQVWAYFYNNENRVKVNYQSVGSSSGIKQTLSTIVDFGGTDAPLNLKELSKSNLYQLPLVAGGIIPVTNIEGIHTAIRLNGKILAGIYMGTLKTWDNKEIQKLNPKIKLPHKDIITIHRSDGSGTTFNFTAYLSSVSPKWKSSYGTHKSLDWINGIGGNGNPGVASSVQSTKNSIGYVELSYVEKGVKNHQFLDVIMENQAHEFVKATSESIADTISNYQWQKSVNGWFLDSENLKINPSKKSWPICAVSFIILKRNNPYITDIGKYIINALNEKGASYPAKVGLTPLSPQLSKEITAFIKKNFTLSNK